MMMTYLEHKTEVQSGQAAGELEFEDAEFSANLFSSHDNSDDVMLSYILETLDD